MGAPAGPADMRALIVERLLGDTGEPDQVTAAARALAERALPAMMRGLDEKLAVAVTMDVASVELTRFAEARPTISNHAMTIAASGSSPDALALSIDTEAIAVVVSALFGGDPSDPAAPIERALSPLELDVATQVFEQVADAVNGSGERAFELRLPVPLAFTGTEMARHMMRDGPAVRIVFSIATAASRGTIALTMPQRVLLKHRGGTGMPAKETAQAADWRARFSEEVMRSTVTLEATMPLSRLTLGQIADLAPGQVIELDENAQANARLAARDRTLFVCEFGKLGQNYTVRIRHPFDAGQDFIDGLTAG